MTRAGEVQVRIDRDGPVCVLGIDGELDIATCGELAALAEPAVTSRAGQLVLDLSGLRFMDSYGASALAILVGSVDTSVPVIVRSASRAVRRVLGTLDIDLERYGPLPGCRAEWLLLESRAVRSWAEETRTRSRRTRRRSEELIAHTSRLRMRSRELTGRLCRENIPGA